MKKLITVLAILVVLAGSVFAADTNTIGAQRSYGEAEITIKALVPEDPPQFEIAIPTTETDAGAQTSAITLRTITNGVISAQTTTTGKTSDLTAAAVTSLTGADANTVVVSFDINQATRANLKAGYTITITATELKLKTFLDGKKFGDEGVTATYDAAKHSFAVSDSTPKVTAVTGTIAGVTLGKVATDDNTLTADYSGAAPVAAQKLGSFDVEWKGNINAVAGNYEATVNMEVAAK